MTITWDYRPSNGTEGAIQRQWTCDHCTVDHDGGWHDDPDNGRLSCPIIESALFGPHDYPNPGPPEWGHDHDTGAYVCTAFQGPCPCEGAV